MMSGLAFLRLAHILSSFPIMQDHPEQQHPSMDNPVVPESVLIDAPSKAAIPSDTNLPSLTGLRIWLALFVLLQHLPLTAVFPDCLRPVYKNFASGSWGVFGFFILSGFIMWHAYSGRKLTCKGFIVNRIARIYPVYLLGIVVALFLTNSPLFRADISLPRAIWLLVSEVFLVQSWGSKSPMTLQYNQPGWTLSVEMFFYILFPFIFFSFTARPKRTIAGLILLLAL